MVMIMLTMLILLTLLMTISTILMTIVLHSGAKAALVPPRFPLWGGLLGRSVSVTVRSSNLIICQNCCEISWHRNDCQNYDRHQSSIFGIFVVLWITLYWTDFLIKMETCFLQISNGKNITWYKENIQRIRWGARESIRERFKELSGEAADRFFVNYNQPWWCLVMFGDVWWCLRMIIIMITLTSN